MKFKILGLLLFLLILSCKPKKEILYLQDIDAYNNTTVTYTNPTIQPNDILKIEVGALVAEAVLPYNRLSTGTSQSQGSNRPNGYLVSAEQTISFPVLGDISVADKTINQLQKELINRLESGGHLVNPTVHITLLNAKITVLGEVSSPGIHTFNETNITLLQALGLAGDLTINGKREDILLIREVDGLRTIAHFDITQADILNSPYYIIKPNDTIIVNPNGPEIQRAGYFGSLGGIIGVITGLFSTILIIIAL